MPLRALRSKNNLLSRIESTGLLILEQKLETLSNRIDELINTVRRLRHDNKALKEQEKMLGEEADRLREKNREAKQRLEVIIARLRQQGGDHS